MSERLNRWLYAPASGHRSAVFRILLGLYLLAYFGVLLPHVTLLFSNQGVHVPYFLPDYAPAPTVAWLLFASMIALDLALLLGYRADLAARLLLLLFLYHYFLQMAVKQSSFDRLIIIYLLVLSFADAGRVFGLDARRPGPRPCVWAERLLGLQTVMLYFGSGLWKALNPAWHTGTLLRSTLQGMWASPLAFAIVQRGFSDRVWTLFSLGIIGFELLLAPLLIVRRTRPLGILLGLGFHLFNTVVLVIPEFLVVATTYVVFVEPATLERVGRRCATLARRLAPRLLQPARSPTTGHDAP
jgi:vitamin K-dependent gamma-carboxylase